MHLGDPASRPWCETRRALLCGALVLLFSATFTHGQDVAEAARQEQARKASQPKASRHVYRDEDLKQQKILTPEDHIRVEAKKKICQPGPSEQNAEQLPLDAEPKPESLGEVARWYRHEKTARTAEQAEGKKFTPFPFQVPHGSLAAPKPGIAPRVGRSPGLELRERTAPLPLLAPQTLPGGPVLRSRISPFQPRPFAAASTVPRTTPPAAPAVDEHTPSALPSYPHAAFVNPGFSPDRAGLQRVQVQRGQSWWKLAQLYLGDGSRWQELRRLNVEQLGPSELLKLGSIAMVPGKAKRTETPPQRSIKVRKGDTLWALAREHLGRSSAWTCLAQANPELKNYMHMRIGEQLQLPTGQALESCQIGNYR
jgi:nucleoid-associated protein YgaU